MAWTIPLTTSCFIQNWGLTLGGNICTLLPPLSKGDYSDHSKRTDLASLPFEFSATPKGENLLPEGEQILSFKNSPSVTGEETASRNCFKLKVISLGSGPIPKIYSRSMIT